VIALGAIGLTAIQVRIDRTPYEAYFGRVNPVGPMAGASVLGFIGLNYLISRSWFDSAPPVAIERWLPAVAGFTLLFGAVAIAADLVLRFSHDTNVAWPDAFLFYPSVAFFVEASLHVAPLALAVAMLGRPREGGSAPFWALIIAVASVEAIFQAATSDTPVLALFSGVHVLVFGVVQLAVFQRFGFVPMYTLRLAYYALWHIAWGHARLHFLF